MSSCYQNNHIELGVFGLLHSIIKNNFQSQAYLYQVLIQPIKWSSGSLLVNCLYWDKDFKKNDYIFTKTTTD